MISVTRRDRRAVYMGLVVLAPALLFVGVIRPLIETSGALRERLASERELLARELGLLEDAKRYTTLVDRTEEIVSTEAPRLIRGIDEATATARLGSYVGDLASRSRIHLQRSDSRPAEPIGADVLALRVEIRAVGDLEGILTYLHALETGENRVHFERLSIEGLNRVPGFSGEPLGLSAILRGYTILNVPESAESPS